MTVNDDSRATKNYTRLQSADSFVPRVRPRCSCWTPSKALVVPLYLGILLCLAVFGFHRSQLIYLYYRYKDRRPRAARAVHATCRR